MNGMRKLLMSLAKQLSMRKFGQEIHALGLQLMRDQYLATWAHMTEVLAGKRMPQKFDLSSDMKGNKLGQNIMGKIFQFLLPENYYLQQLNKQSEVVCNYWKNARTKSKIETMDKDYVKKSQEKLLQLLLKAHQEGCFLAKKTN